MCPLHTGEVGENWLGLLGHRLLPLVLLHGEFSAILFLRKRRDLDFKKMSNVVGKYICAVGLLGPKSVCHITFSAEFE